MKQSTLDILSLILISLLAAGLRFTQFGDFSLTAQEANQATQALKVFSNTAGSLGASPLYIGLTGVLFSLFGASELTARLLPGIVGLIFCFSPLLVREKIGKTTSLLAALFFAVNPFLIFLSREAGGGMVSVAFVTWFFIALARRNSLWMGILGVLAVLSGPAAFTGILGITLAAVWMKGKVFANDPAGEPEQESPVDWKTLFFSGGITFLAAGFLFLSAPQLINSFGAGILEALKGWIPSQTMEQQGMLTRLVVGLFLLMPLTVLLGISGLTRGLIQKDSLTGFFARWALISVVVIFIYSAHRVADLAWVSIPLCLAAAMEIQKWVYKPSEHRAIAYLFAAGCSLLLIFSGLKLADLLVYEPGSADFQLAVAGVALTILMLAAASILIGWGWSWKVSFFGLGIGAIVVLSIFSLSMSRRAASLGGQAATNLLNQGPYPLETGLWKSTVDDVSRLNTGVPGSLGIVVFKLDQPLFHWNLRDYPEAVYTNSLAIADAPQLLVTNASEALELPASYRGQDFAHAAVVPWSLLTTKEWVNWILFGNAPLQKEYLILWARNDLFPGSDTDQISQ